MISFEPFREDSWICWDSFNCDTLNPEHLNIKKEEIENYLKKNPMPKDEHYSKQDLINDLTGSSGAYVLPTKTKEETAEFIAKLIDDLI